MFVFYNFILAVELEDVLDLVLHSFDLNAFEHHFLLQDFLQSHCPLLLLIYFGPLVLYELYLLQKSFLILF